MPWLITSSNCWELFPFFSSRRYFMLLKLFRDLLIIQAMDQKQVGMRILNLGMDTRTPTGKLMLIVLGGVAQFEREMMLERQLEGIAKAQAAGKYRGRKPIAMERQAEVRRLAATGMAKARIALELKIGEATVYRILARDREQAHPASSA